MIDLIWNITRICTWNCAICCVDAIQANSVSWNETLVNLERTKTELNLEEKMLVLQNLKSINCKIDFSGGDPLGHPHTLVVLKEASSLFGRSNVTLTATGATLVHSHFEEILPLIGELNFTYDLPASRENHYRPLGYAKSNLLSVSTLRRNGLSIRAECPLTTWNTDDSAIEELYLELNNFGIDELLLMRMFPVGRGVLNSNIMLSADRYKKAISHFFNLERIYRVPKIKLQCALRIFDSTDNQTENPCDLLDNSLGLMPDGTLLASPWAYGVSGKPLGDEWVLGNLAKESIENILFSPKTQKYKKLLNKNFGHCKVFAWIFSKKTDGLQRIFDTTDPIVNALTLSK